MSKFKKVIDIYVKIANIIMISLLGSIVILTVRELIARNLFDSSLVATTDLCKLLFVWTSFLGLIDLFNRNALLKIDMVYCRVSNKLQYIFWFIGQIIILLLGLIMIISFLGLYPYTSTSRFSSMQFLSKTWDFVPIAVSGLFLVLKSIYNMFEKIMFTKKQSIQKGDKIW